MIRSGPFRFLAGAHAMRARGLREIHRLCPPSQRHAGLASGPKIVNIDRVEWQTIPDPATAAAALPSGSGDLW